ncbi:MAG: hypothetical protein AAGG02_03625 [Cyanobacteria bacterium P01_H01_bin.15]
MHRVFPATRETYTPDSAISTGNRKFIDYLDGILRNLPMTALYDSERQQYLIENYPVAVASGL